MVSLLQLSLLACCCALSSGWYGSTQHERVPADAPAYAAPAASARAEALRFLRLRLPRAAWCTTRTPPPSVSLLRHAGADGVRRNLTATVVRDGAPTLLSHEPALGASVSLLWQLLVLRPGGSSESESTAACAAELAAVGASDGTAADAADDAGSAASAAPFDGACAALPACAALAQASAGRLEEAHTLAVMIGLNAALDVGVVRHTWTRAATAASSAPAPAPQRIALRLLSFNLWNVNPPRWLWRAPADRLRQYAFRMYHAGDILRQSAPDVLALQEVRYESTLGGRGAPFDGALERAEDWYNRTRAISAMPRYVERNLAWWTAVTQSPAFDALVRWHPIESAPPPPPPPPPPAANASDGDGAAASADGVAAAPPSASPAPPQDPYSRNMARGPAELGAVRAALRRHPHAQLEHVTAHLPGHQFVFQPAQMYMDPSRWLAEGEAHRDEEGPAIFSRHPIVHSDHLLLSRDAADDGDSHQRLCLHAVIDVGGGDAAAVLVDVYTVHLALSERARNRTVQELAAFVRASARGALQVLTGDMNAEPHEPAMRWLAGRLEGALRLAEHRAPTPTPTPLPLPGEPVAPDGAGEDAEPPATPAAYADAPVRLCGAAAGVYERCPPRAAAATQLAADGGAADAADEEERADAAASFTDAFSLTYGASVAEPTPGDADAALRRFAFTFPSDNPIKRIDLVLLATPEGTQLRGPHEAAAAAAAAAAAEGAAAAAEGGAWTATTERYFLLGQDGLPGTEAYEGRGLGMTSDRAPVYASDHRAVALDLVLERQAAAAEAAA